MTFERILDEFESFIGVNLWTLIFAWINLVILYFFLKKLLFKPVKNMIDSRQKEIDDLYADAEEKRALAEADKAAYEEKLRLAEEESEEILRTAQRRAQLKEEAILREADEAARRTLKRADEQVELEKKRAINEVKDEVSGMALEIAASILGRDIKANEHSAMIDDFLRQMEP